MRKIVYNEGNKRRVRYIGLTVREAVLLSIDSNRKGIPYKLPNVPLAWRCFIRSCAALGIVPPDDEVFDEPHYEGGEPIFMQSPSEPLLLPFASDTTKPSRLQNYKYNEEK